MSFRTVVITKQAKLNYQNRFLVVKNGIEESYIHLSEIDTIIVDSISVSISSYLLKELSQNKINIIFCDERHNPFGELSSFYARHNSSKMLMLQIKWTQKQKDSLWKQIVVNKITNQSYVLKKTKSKNKDRLLSYVLEVEVGDQTNREGHAAKVYFNSLFGSDFVRNQEDVVNAALNYGYAILLSTINKEIVSLGLLTQLGIHHKNEFNEFNFSCDLMEPFRPIIDSFVFYNQDRAFDQEYKMDIVNLLNHTFSYKGKQYTLKDILKLYVKNVVDVLMEKKEYDGFIYEG